jgi:hypothetical protein
MLDRMPLKAYYALGTYIIYLIWESEKVANPKKLNWIILGSIFDIVQRCQNLLYLIIYRYDANQIINTWCFLQMIELRDLKSIAFTIIIFYGLCFFIMVTLPICQLMFFYSTYMFFIPLATIEITRQEGKEDASSIRFFWFILNQGCHLLYNILHPGTGRSCCKCLSCFRYNQNSMPGLRTIHLAPRRLKGPGIKNVISGLCHWSFSCLFNTWHFHMKRSHENTLFARTL